MNISSKILRNSVKASLGYHVHENATRHSTDLSPLTNKIESVHPRVQVEICVKSKEISSWNFEISRSQELDSWMDWQERKCLNVETQSWTVVAGFQTTIPSDSSYDILPIHITWTWYDTHCRNVNMVCKNATVSLDRWSVTCQHSISRRLGC